jgi:hypothetical protein
VRTCRQEGAEAAAKTDVRISRVNMRAQAREDKMERDAAVHLVEPP